MSEINNNQSSGQPTMSQRAKYVMTLVVNQFKVEHLFAGVLPKWCTVSPVVIPLLRFAGTS